MGTNQELNDIFKHAVRTSITLEALTGYRRKGHSVPTQTNREWDRLRNERRLRFNEWKRYTERLIADGVLANDACYECAGELIENKDRPYEWVWDETEEEYKARTQGAGDVPA